MTADLILGFDTTGRCGSACLATATGVLETVEWSASSSHTINLHDAGAALLKQAGNRLVAVAVAAGPGGFSSVRSGMAFAKGLCLALDVRLATVESLSALAASVLPIDHRRVAAALHAGRAGYFVREFAVQGSAAKPVSEAALISASALVAMGAGGALLTGEFDSEQRHELEILGRGAVLQFAPAGRPMAEAVAMAGWTRLGELSGEEVHTATPSYLRAPGATLPKKGWGRA